MKGLPKNMKNRVPTSVVASHVGSRLRCLRRSPPLLLALSSNQMSSGYPKLRWHRRNTESTTAPSYFPPELVRWVGTCGDVTDLGTGHGTSRRHLGFQNPGRSLRCVASNTSNYIGIKAQQIKNNTCTLGRGSPHSSLFQYTPNCLQ